MLGHGHEAERKNPAGAVRQSKDGAWSSPLTHRRDKGGDAATGFWAIRGPRPPRTRTRYRPFSALPRPARTERRGWPVSEAEPSFHQVCTPHGAPSQESTPQLPGPAKPKTLPTGLPHWARGEGEGRPPGGEQSPAQQRNKPSRTLPPDLGPVPPPDCYSFIFFFLRWGLSQVASGTSDLSS